MFGHGT